MHIPHSRPTFGKAFEHAANTLIQSGFLAQGSQTKVLEHSIQSFLQQRHVLAVDSGTSALMLAIRCLTQHKTHARVGIPSYACASLLFAVKAAGAQPIFMDCDASLCLEKEQALKTAKTLDVLVLVHPFGMVEPLVEEDFTCPVIEDIAQSVGATLHGKAAGTFGDLSIGSLYATKPWGGAYGGFITSQDLTLIETIKPMSNPDHADIHQVYAGHHQLSDLHAVIAIERLKVAESTQTQRQHWAYMYDKLLKNASATIIGAQPNTTSNYFRYIIRVDSHAADIIKKFQTFGIDASHPILKPLHLSEESHVCPQASQAWQNCVSLPMLADMNQKEFEHMQYGIEQCLYA